MSGDQIPEQVFLDAARALQGVFAGTTEQLAAEPRVRAAVESVWNARQAAVPDEPRTWALPRQPADVHSVIGERSGDRYELNDNGDWVDPAGDDFDWSNLLAIEGKVTDATPADGQDGDGT